MRNNTASGGVHFSRVQTGAPWLKAPSAQLLVGRGFAARRAATRVIADGTLCRA